jgi:hypothetical protein
MTDTTTPEAEQPFDPEAAGRIQALIDDIDRIRAQQPEHMRSLPVAPTLDGNTRHGARVDDLREMVRQRAYAKNEARLLAERSASWRGQYEEQHARADHLQALADERARTIIELGDQLRKVGVEQ